MRYEIPILSLIACLLPAVATAQSVPARPDPLTTAASAPVEVAHDARPAEPAAISLEDLADLNGKQGDRTSVAMSEQDLNAVNHGNTVTANVVGSGQISIGRGAYEGFAGVGNFVINSGHNNNLQGALTINIVSP